jgi:hypothetical protein
MIQTPTRGLRLRRRDRTTWLAERPIHPARDLPLVALLAHSSPVGIDLEEQGLWEVAPAGAVVGSADTALWVMAHPGAPETPVACFLAPTAATHYDLTTAARHALAGRPTLPTQPSARALWFPVIAVVACVVLALIGTLTGHADFSNVNPI